MNLKQELRMFYYDELRGKIVHIILVLMFCITIFLVANKFATEIYVTECSKRVADGTLDVENFSNIMSDILGTEIRYSMSVEDRTEIKEK